MFISFDYNVRFRDYVSKGPYALAEDVLKEVQYRNIIYIIVKY